MTRKANVRRMWTTHQQLIGDNDGTFKLWYNKGNSAMAVPACVIDLSPESVEALVEKVAQATMAWERNRYGRIGNSNTKTYRMQARAALAAILPLPRTRKRRE